MKAIAAQHGKVLITNTERPSLPAGHVRIRTEYSAISPGTEMSIIKMASDQKVVIGYSAVGIIVEIGEQVTGLQVGQRVACYGAPYVRHAEELAVPSNLTAVVPDHVSPEEAAFAGLGAIAIHALRVADLRFGESAVVVGLGILGQIIAQISSAAANQVFGYDLNKERVLSMKQQIDHVYDSQEELENQIAAITSGYGADSVILCASGSGEELINSSLKWIRNKGKIVIVGDLTMNFSRGLMFGKEAQVLISRAGGPGRYDTGYELENKDYPIGFVRWTEGRNVAEYIRLLAEKRISMKSLISRIIPFESAQEAYDQYGPSSTIMGTVFKYGK
ncbi:D-arabinose 1-dehydrogenase, Zn-dependent alcohol dehydrogenase family [Paenibacillus uliginis N3/975]|uniref:D-arabinose 1-dehydrogenase, Zn-dependent alcohol dehydrogenase family n=1 Tax=Paenibacillus uliginis N3/975 TaxID=1313296 RepID=A0A1X7HRM7_9BACL|nr:zinc-binding alcohol dehydrogenase [Paenibacillus uliginis]SMF91710.1 D-arabinose 1-dehydrogenase, Zn-dependent alcohol dehydrogenase family [Paenibacillus uliginis N3/975]